MAGKTVGGKAGVDFNISGLSPQGINALLDIEITRVSIPAGTNTLVARPDPNRVYIAFTCPPAGAFGIFVAPWPDPINVSMAQVLLTGNAVFKLADHFQLVQMAWYGYTNIGMGNAVFNVITQRRR